MEHKMKKLIVLIFFLTTLCIAQNIASKKVSRPVENKKLSNDQIAIYAAFLKSFSPEMSNSVIKLSNRTINLSYADLMACQHKFKIANEKDAYIG
jgi:hypothetical protein